MERMQIEYSLEWAETAIQGMQEECSLGVVAKLEKINDAVEVMQDQCSLGLVAEAEHLNDAVPVEGRQEECFVDAAWAWHSASMPSSGGDGSSRSAVSDKGSGNAPGGRPGQSNPRKTLPVRSTQVRVCSVQDVSALDDGFSWRKYGQKDVLGAKYPRAYYRCTHGHTQGCPARKRVQRTDGDPLLFDVVYVGNYTCRDPGAAAHPSNQSMLPTAAAAARLEHSQSQAYYSYHGPF